VPAADQHASWAARLEGTVVLVAGDGAVITVYRNRRALRTIVKKMKYTLPDFIGGRGWGDDATNAVPGVADRTTSGA